MFFIKHPNYSKIIKNILEINNIELINFYICIKKLLLWLF